MRWFVVVLALLVAVSAYAADLNVAKPMKYVASGGYAVLDSVARGGSQTEFEKWYLFKAQASEAVYIRRKFDISTMYSAKWDTMPGADFLDATKQAWRDSVQWELGPGILIPAGKSLIFSVPYTWNAAGTHMVQLIQVSTLTDTLEALPWQR